MPNMDRVPLLLRSLAAEALASVVSVLPSDNIRRLICMIEATRVVDYNTIIDGLLPPGRRLPAPDLEIVKTGWGALAAECLAPFAQAGAFPLMESTAETRRAVMGMLHRCGQSVHLRRAADMVQFGLMTASETHSVIELARAPHTHSEFLDILEFAHLRRFDDLVKARKIPFYKGWTILEHSHLTDVLARPGAFMSRANDRLESFRHEDIDSLMIPLIRPWDSGHGLMMAYGALPEIDDHFMSEAMEFILECRTECGLHPSAAIPSVDAADLTAIAAVIAGLHMKHVRFALLAMKHCPDILIPQSMTIWTPAQELANSVADWTHLSPDRVVAAMDALTIRASESEFLRTHTLPQVPLLIGLDNGIVLRPVASIARNPLITTLDLLRWRHPSARNALMGPRGDWLRTDLYAIFSGTG